LVHSPPPDDLTSTRLFAASVARRFGSGEEQAADVKLAVSEACANAVQARRYATVAVEMRESGGVVAVRVGPVDRDAPGFLGFDVIRALFGPVRFDEAAGGGWVVGFSFRPRAGSPA
jgi:anti-sigma regulatory factor (Ser/Thr protein kinase)